MDRIRGAGNVAGMFVAEDVSASQPPTEITAEWLNSVQEEIVAVATANGASLDPSDNGQLLAAVVWLISQHAPVLAAASESSAGKSRLATTAETIAGALSDVAVHPAGALALVSAKVADLVNSSPAALDTLKELSDALGGDASFATTVMNALADRLTQAQGDARYAMVGGASVPTGTVIHVGMNSVPAGFLKANGSAISRATYSALFTAIGTTFGTGDGSTTFNLPDLRGEFVRGWDDGRGVDSGRTFGSAQAGSVESHTHSYKRLTTGDYVTGGPSGMPTSPYDTQSGAYGGTETRPRNVALLACIKY